MIWLRPLGYIAGSRGGSREQTFGKVCNDHARGVFRTPICRNVLYGEGDNVFSGRERPCRTHRIRHISLHCPERGRGKCIRRIHAAGMRLCTTATAAGNGASGYRYIGAWMHGKETGVHVVSTGYIGENKGCFLSLHRRRIFIIYLSFRLIIAYGCNSI